MLVKWVLYWRRKSMSDGVVVHCSGLGMLVECAGKWEELKKRFKIILTLAVYDSSQISFMFIWVISSPFYAWLYSLLTLSCISDFSHILL
jgi:hypothetical protein